MEETIKLELEERLGSQEGGVACAPYECRAP